MAFTIKLETGRDVYDDDHTLEVKDSGILEVKKGGAQVAMYSPAHWVRVTPGTPPPRKAARIH